MDLIDRCDTLNGPLYPWPFSPVSQDDPVKVWPIFDAPSPR
jgi:hypothetical protein